MDNYTKDKIDTYHAYCKKCKQKFAIVVPYVENIKIEFCPSCGEKISNPIYYRDYGKKIRVKLDDGCLHINMDK